MRLAEDGLGMRGCQRPRVPQMADKGKQEVLESAVHLSRAYSPWRRACQR